MSLTEPSSKPNEVTEGQHSALCVLRVPLMDSTNDLKTYASRVLSVSQINTSAPVFPAMSDRPPA